MVRRAEYALGKAIRKGQAAGEIRTDGQRATDKNGSSVGVIDIAPDFYSNSAKGGAISQLVDGDVSEEEFEAALADAREDHNLSRANVVRKIKAKKTGADVTGRADRRYCSAACRQGAYRERSGST